MNTIDITPVVNAVIALAATVVSVFLIPWIKCFTDTPLLVFTGGQAFFLRIGCQNGQH